MEDVDPTEAAAAALGEQVGPERPTPEAADPDPSEDTDGRLGSIGKMLSATEPDVSPSQASGTLDLSAPWHAHAEVFVAKVTNSQGTPAWLNLVMAGLLLIADQGDNSAPSTDDGDDAGREDVEDVEEGEMTTDLGGGVSAV